MERKKEPDDCFLCNALPFLRAIFPAHRDNIVQDPRSLEPAVAPVAPAASAAPKPPKVQKKNDAYEKTNMDFSSVDYRGFIFAIHPDHGYVLLHCTRKKKKPNHFQLPGGHIDAFEFADAAKVTQDPKEQLVHAGKLGAARELYEETGMDVRNALDRLKPTNLYEKDKKDKVSNEYKSRLFYTVHVTDDDFLKAEDMSIADAAFLQRPMGARPPNLMVRHELLQLDNYLFADTNFRLLFYILLTD